MSGNIILSDPKLGEFPMVGTRQGELKRTKEVARGSGQPAPVGGELVKTRGAELDEEVMQTPARRGLVEAWEERGPQPGRAAA